MRHWFRTLDRILRGEATQLSQLREAKLEIPARGLALLNILLGVLYGFCMGWFAIFSRDDPQYMQIIACMLKVPALFALTLLITFPSLYVFNTLVGSRLTGLTLFRLLVAALSVTLAILASFGPIVAFFSVTTTSYSFMVLFNVLIFSVAGVLGLKFLLQTLYRLSLRGQHAPPTPPAKKATTEPKQAEEPIVQVEEQPKGALEPIEGSLLSGAVKSVFGCWLVVFTLVGVQLSWVLRPFIGHPGTEFTWFRHRESHFFEAVWRALLSLLGGNG
jgi:hypothetical protein